MGMQENITIKESIFKQVTEQFSEYDHHNQRLFVQFFSAVFVVLIGYAYVFSNQSFLYPSTNISGEKYTLMHLLAVYVVAQIILIFLSTLILNIGYCFRRDQLIIFNIRKKVFTDDEYRKIFGSRANNPLNKGLLKDSYLPTFNALFFRLIILVQTTLFVFMVIGLENSTTSLLSFVQNHRFTYVYILSFISIGSSNKFNSIMAYLVKRLRRINKKVTCSQQLRTSVFVHWLKMYNLRQVQYMAGHRYISSTESILVNEMDEMTEDIEKNHPIG